MSKIARYLALMFVILLLERQKCLCKTISADGSNVYIQKQTEDDDYDIFDYFFSLFDWDYDSEEEDKTYLICQNCTVVLNQQSDTSTDPDKSGPEKIPTTLPATNQQTVTTPQAKTEPQTATKPQTATTPQTATEQQTTTKAQTATEPKTTEPKTSEPQTTTNQQPSETESSASTTTDQMG